MDECKAMHIPVKGPDVNESFSEFGVNKQGDIRFGLAAIKGVGENVAADIIKARNDGGPFESIYDFVERVPLAALNRRTFESLALAGAFDCFEGIKREDFFEKNNRDESLSEQLLRYGQLFQQASMQQSASLFGDEDMSLNTAGRPVVRPGIEWVSAVRLEKERELVGMYLSAHPLDPYYMELTYGCSSSIKDLNEGVKEDGRELTFGGMVTKFESRPSKKGGNFGRLSLEDYTGSTEIMLFGKDYINYANYGQPGTNILVTGKYSRDYKGELRFNVTNIKLLEEIKNKLIEGITVRISPKDMNDTLKSLIIDHMNSATTDRGSLRFQVYDPEINRSVTMQSGIKIPLNRELANMLDSIGVEYAFTKYQN